MTDYSIAMTITPDDKVASIRSVIKAMGYLIAMTPRYMTREDLTTFFNLALAAEFDNFSIPVELIQLEQGEAT